MRSVSLALVVVAGFLAAPASHADPLDFMFSFTGTVPPGTVAGTVTGEIFGLTDNATGPAANVVVDSYPSGLGLPSPPLTVFTHPNFNAFTVTSGAITNANYEAFTDNTFTIQLDLNRSNLANNLLLEGPPIVVTQNNGGFAGATYSLVQPVPEPASLAIFGTALAGLGLMRRRRKDV